MSTDVFTLPRDFETETGVPPVVFYSAAASSVKNRVVLSKNLCCFLLSGIKKVHAPDSCLQAGGGELLMLSAGNVLMTETLTGQDQYEAILVFLDHNDLIRADGGIAEGISVSKIPFDEFLENFIRSLKLLRDCSNTDLLRLKARELAIYLREYYPLHYVALKYKDISNHSIYKFKHIISENTFNNLSISELSFLCSMSVSTFKRHFAEIYGVAPQRYFFEQRMTEAGRLLASGSRPIEVFERIGYESLAAFSSAFRKHFGCSPKRYLSNFELADKVFEPAAKQPIQNF